MELRVKIKNVFGNKTIYPLCEKGILLAKFKKQITFTPSDVEMLKEIGYTFKVEADEI